MRWDIWDIWSLENLVTLISPLKVIQGHVVNWKIIYDFLYVFHSYFDHKIRDISMNRSQRSKLDLSGLAKWHTDSTVFLFHHIVDINPTKLHYADKMGRTLVLLNGFWQYGYNYKRCKIRPFQPSKRTFKAIQSQPSFNAS